MQRLSKIQENGIKVEYLESDKPIEIVVEQFHKIFRKYVKENK